MKLLPLLLLPFLTTPAYADQWFTDGVRETRCTKEVYTERYIPGTRTRPGYVHTETHYQEVPCRGRTVRHYHSPVPRHTSRDENSCIEGSVLGGIAGGGLGAALSRGDGRYWAIPLGIVGGALVGCQVDGG